jgi:hypothetical protein
MAHIATVHAAPAMLFLRMPLLRHRVPAQTISDPFGRTNTLKPNKPKRTDADGRIFMQSTASAPHTNVHVLQHTGIM